MEPLNLERANRIADTLAVMLGVRRSEFIVRDHTHEGLSPGAFSIGMEGWNADRPWTYMAADAQRWPVSPFGPGVFAEPVSSWCLALYPDPTVTGTPEQDEYSPNACAYCHGWIVWQRTDGRYIHAAPARGLLQDHQVGDPVSPIDVTWTDGKDR